MSSSTPPNLLADIFRIEDPSIRQAAKSIWDALNASRAQIGELGQQIAALQAQDSATAARLASIGVEGLASITQSLVSEVGIANDHPYLVLSHSVNLTSVTGVRLDLNWDTEQLTAGGTFHDVAVSNERVYIGRKPGLWLSIAAITFDASAVGIREVRFDRSGGFWEYHTVLPPAAGGFATSFTNVGILITRGANDPWGAGWVKTTVLQNSGGNLAILSSLFGGSVWGLYYLAPLPVGQRLYT
jgi:hypothetical protein